MRETRDMREKHEFGWSGLSGGSGSSGSWNKRETRERYKPCEKGIIDRALKLWSNSRSPHTPSRPSLSNPQLPPLGCGTVKNIGSNPTCLTDKVPLLQSGGGVNSPPLSIPCRIHKNADPGDVVENWHFCLFHSRKVKGERLRGKEPFSNRRRDCQLQWNILNCLQLF